VKTVEQVMTEFRGVGGFSDNRKMLAMCERIAILEYEADELRARSKISTAPLEKALAAMTVERDSLLTELRLTKRALDASILALETALKEMAGKDAAQ